LPRIFISYRRDDSAVRARRLHDALDQHFGEGHAFMDVESIEAGLDFARAIDLAVRSGDVMLVVIGNEWLVDRSGRRNLSEPGDPVRLEVEAALEANIRIIPILVDGAPMPSNDELPATLAMLNRRQAFDVSDATWRPDIDELLKRLERIGGRAEDPPRRPRSRRSSRSWLARLRRGRQKDLS